MPPVSGMHVMDLTSVASRAALCVLRCLSPFTVSVYLSFVVFVLFTVRHLNVWQIRRKWHPYLE